MCLPRPRIWLRKRIDLDENFLLSEIVRCVQGGQLFTAGPGNIVRDFVHPADLVQLVMACLGHDHLNDVFDVYSAGPATKFEIIDYFSREHGLRFQVEETFAAANVTGAKDHYYSTNHRAAALGYAPRFTSLAGIADELGRLMRPSSQ